MLAEQLKIYLDKAGIHYAWVMAAMVLLCLAIYLKQFLELRKYSQIIPILSGIFLVSIGILNLVSNWI